MPTLTAVLTPSRASTASLLLSLPPSLPLRQGFLLVLCGVMLVLPILGSLGFSQSQFLMIKLGSRMRSACIAAVYRKSLNLHSIQSTEAEVKDFLAKKLLAGTSGDTGGGKGEGGRDIRH